MSKSNDSSKLATNAGWDFNDGVVRVNGVMLSDGPVNIRRHGLRSHEESPNFDNATLWESAIASGEDLLIPAGTFISSAGIAMRDGLVLVGQGKNSVLKLADGSDDHVLYSFTGASDVRLEHFRIDGNKALQTLGVANRGIYFLGRSQRLLLDDLTLDNVCDHGIFLSGGNAPATTTTGAVSSAVVPVASTSGVHAGMTAKAVGLLDFPVVLSVDSSTQVTLSSTQHLASGTPIWFIDECGTDSVVMRSRVNGCGSNAHLAAGGPGGTGFAGGARTTMWSANVARGNRLNGFKMNAGLLSQCQSILCGGGFETGFVETASDVAVTYEQCAAMFCGSGWRHQSSGDEITHTACRAEGCGGSGAAIIGAVNRVVFNGFISKNNGRGFDPFGNAITRTPTTVGLDGITILSNTATPRDIYLSNVHCFDDQNAKTQQWGLYRGGTVDNLQINAGCDFRGNLTGDIFVPA